MALEDVFTQQLRDVAALLAELRAQLRELTRPGLPKGQHDALAEKVTEIGEKLAAIGAAMGQITPVEHVTGLPPVEFDN